MYIDHNGPELTNGSAPPQWRSNSRKHSALSVSSVLTPCFSLPAFRSEFPTGYTSVHRNFLCRCALHPETAQDNEGESMQKQDRSRTQKEPCQPASKPPPHRSWTKLTWVVSSDDDADDDNSDMIQRWKRAINFTKETPTYAPKQRWSISKRDSQWEKNDILRTINGPHRKQWPVPQSWTSSHRHSLYPRGAASTGAALLRAAPWGRQSILGNGAIHGTARQ